MEKKHLLFPLRLQLFADGDGGATDGGEGKKGEETPKQKYTDEEYEKLKSQFDKTSSEIASLKKQLKDKQTEEEKKASAEKEKAEEIENIKKELLTYKIKSKLASVFDEKEIEELTAKIVAGDIEALTDAIFTIRTNYKTKVYDEAKKEFNQSSTLPGGTGGGSGEKSLGEKMAEESKIKRTKNSPSKKWGQFDNE